MRSRTDARLRGPMLALVLLALLQGLAAAVDQAQAESGSISSAEIARALDGVRSDPNLAYERTVRTLKWKDADAPPPRSGTPWWVRWLAGLFGWISQSARVLMWGTAALLVGVLVVFLIRLVLRPAKIGREVPPVVPTHVRDLDIRPETLPADIGAAARALWDGGEHRASLALLYRGLLSRLAHVHRVPIRDSSTEGDCLVLAGRLPPRRREYASRVVRLRQAAVYGGQQVEAAAVYLLCDEFAPAIGSASSVDGPPSAGAS